MRLRVRKRMLQKHKNKPIKKLHREYIVQFFYCIELIYFKNLASAYSVLSATTGSFFAALLDGMIPEIRVRSTLIATRIIAAGIGR